MVSTSKIRLLLTGLALLYICSWLTSVVHEAGHVVATSLTSYRVSGIIIGGGSLSREQIGAIETEYGPPGILVGPYIGSSKTLIQRGVPVPKPSEYIFILLGGSLANLIAVLAFYHFRGSQDFTVLRDFITCKRMPTAGALFLLINMYDIAALFVPVAGTDGWHLLQVLLGSPIPA